MLRFFMKILSLALSVALLPVGSALSAGISAYTKGRLLTIPSINTDEQVGKYQDVVFTLTEQGAWQLLSGKAINEPGAIGASAIGLSPQLIEQVDVVKTDTFPVQVFLRVFGSFWPCHDETLGQINQRLENNRFDVAITINYIVPNPAPVLTCVAMNKSFARTIPLPVYGLSAGVYSYSVNGSKTGWNGNSTTGTFELTADNKLPEVSPVYADPYSYTKKRRDSH